MLIKASADSKWICEYQINNINNVIKWHSHHGYLSYALEWKSARKTTWYFKFCVVSTFDTTNCKVGKFLFKFKKINDCVITSVAAEKRFYCIKIITSEICH